MSDLVSVAAIKDLLTECPICIEHFDDATRIPRRMPCCVQSICQPCLETYTAGAATLSCPMCRCRHKLPGGVKSLPKETVILKTLDYLKIQKGLHLPCTDCPDKETAVAQCDNCGVFLCSLCLNAHRRNMVTKAHTINTFDEMKGRPVQSSRRVQQCRQHQQPLQFYCRKCDKVVCVSCTVVDHDKGKGHNVVSVDEAHQERSKSSDDLFVKIKEKSDRLSKAEAELMLKIENMEMSKRVAIDDINKTFDNLSNDLKQRRTVLLSDVERQSAQNLKLTKEALESTRGLQTKVKSSTDYTRQMRSKADKIEDLQVMGSSTPSLRAMLEETLHKVPFVRTGVNFVQANIKHIRDNIKTAGMVRSVTFSPRERPNKVPDTAVYNATTLEPADFPNFGQSCDLQLGFLLDGANDKIQVLNATDNTVYTTVTDVALDRPMWVKMYACRPSTLESRVELLSGYNITGSFTDYNR